MCELMPLMQHHFDAVQDRLACFCAVSMQCEGWFKGELFTLLTQLRTEGAVQDVDRAVRVDGKQIDVLIRSQASVHWVERKHWRVGTQRGVPDGSRSYFADPTIGILQAVNKLAALSRPGHRWLLLLLTAKPRRETGRSASSNSTPRLRRIGSKHAHRQPSSRQPSAWAAWISACLLIYAWEIRAHAALNHSHGCRPLAIP